MVKKINLSGATETAVKKLDRIPEEENSSEPPGTIVLKKTICK